MNELVRPLEEGRRRRRNGEFTAAAAVLREAVARGEALFGPCAPELAMLLNELGMVGKHAGDFDAADRAYRRALPLAEGPDRAAILHNMAGLAHARGDAHGALPLALLGIEMRGDAAGLAEDRAALAAILVDLGRHEDARTILEQTLHERTACSAVALHNLGSMQFREGDLVAAVKSLRKALALKSAELGNHHPDLAVTLHNLACCLLDTGHRRRARRYLRRAVAILENAVAADHPTLVACRETLATAGTRATAP